MSIKIELEFSDKQIADLMCSAIEGGYGREWCKEIDTVYAIGLRKQAKPWGKEYTPSYIAAPFTDGAALIVRVHAHWIGTAIGTARGSAVLANEGEPKVEAEYRITRKELAAGLHAMATKHPKHFADFIGDNSDAITGDVFLQCCTMGEIVFG